MQISNMRGGHEAICTQLDSLFIKEIYKIQHAPTTWNTIFPASCYHSDFRWPEQSITLPALENFGTFADMGLKEAKDVPEADFSLKSERINLYEKQCNIILTREEVDHYLLWTERAGFSGEMSSFIQRKIDAVRETYQLQHNKYFFKGDGVNTTGLFGSSMVTDITDRIFNITDPVEWFSTAISYIRMISKGVLKASKALISPALYGYLNKYYESSDVSTLQKINGILIDKGVNLAVEVLDMLTDTVTGMDSESVVDAAKPFGDVYFLSNNPVNFAYYFKPILIYDFRAYLARSFITATKFKYSDPYIYAQHAICKATAPNFENPKKVKKA
jgi:hypothetical protein